MWGLTNYHSRVDIYRLKVRLFPLSSPTRRFRWDGRYAKTVKGIGDVWNQKSRMYIKSFPIIVDSGYRRPFLIYSITFVLRRVHQPFVTIYNKSIR